MHKAETSGTNFIAATIDLSENEKPWQETILLLVKHHWCKYLIPNLRHIDKRHIDMSSCKPFSSLLGLLQAGP